MTTKRQGGSEADVTIVSTTCAHDCGCNSNCLLKLHVRDGVIIRIETDDADEPQLRACARGRAQRQRVYAPDRIKYPMKRIGARGEGKFEQISWDEALDKIASEMKRIKTANGPGAFVNLQYAGEDGLQGRAVGRLLNLFGGNLQHWGGASLEGNYWSAQATYGLRTAALQAADPFAARLIIMWGWNPANNRYTASTNLRMAQAREAGTRVICIDPRYTASASLYADEWLPIIPGTDTAMLIAMAHVMITENLHDEKFLDVNTVGFDKFRDYVLGMEDGIAKTPAWAEAITGLPVASIEKLAREYATTRPAALMIAWGPGRTAYGEQYFRAAHTLMAMTANIYVSTSATPGGSIPIRHAFAKGRNPFNYEEGAPKHAGASLDPAVKSRRQVLQGDLYDAILHGKAGGFPSDIRMVWVNCGNTLNQLPNTNKGVRAFRQLEFIVVSEQFMTPTAKFADILLPAATHFERNSIYGGHNPHGGGNIHTGAGSVFFAGKAIEPAGESKTDFQICAELAPRLGIEEYSDKTEDEWLRWSMGGPGMEKHIPDYDSFRKRGVYKFPLSDQTTPRQPEVFPTPSGKMEIYSQLIADLNNPEIPPIPKYMETWESRNDPLAKKYPFQLISSHHKLRAHSNFHNVKWLTDLEPQRVSLNATDAANRDIHNGEVVRIFNDRGEIRIAAFVTETIMPGVVDICEGAWYDPDSQGIDRGGCPNVLTRDVHSPVGAWCTHTSLVQVAKIQARR